MRVALVNYEAAFGGNGILTKFAERMNYELLSMGIESKITPEPDLDCDVNHHINYLQYKHNPAYKGTDTLMVTHFLGNEYKLGVLKEALKTSHGVCMSKEMVENLVKDGYPKEKLLSLEPPHDQRKRRPIVIAITTKVYPDGCKREDMLTKLFHSIDKDKFAFRIMGDGWRETLEPLISEGMQVEYFEEFDKDIYGFILDSADYYLYFGLDEGSMGTIDAVNAGLRTITTPQGFHLDIPGGITHPFTTQKELNDIFKKLEENPVENWSWKKYTNEHLQLWKSL